MIPFLHFKLKKISILPAIILLLCVELLHAQPKAPVAKSILPEQFFKLQAKPTRSTGEIESTSRKAPAAAPEAAYYYPGLVPFDGPGTFISFSQKWNKIDSLYDPNKAFILYPVEQEVTYYDASSSTPTEYFWYAPGSADVSANSQDMVTTYLNKGLYPFPSLRTVNADGESTFQAPYRLQIGDTAEICGFNSHSPKTSANPNGTYEPVYWKWDNSKGYMTGTNKMNVDAFGTSVQLGQEVSEMLEVNVYVRRYPTAYDDNAKLKLSIWATGVDNDGYYKPNFHLEDTVVIKFSDIMPVATSITGLKYKSGDPIMGMATFKLPKPMLVPSDFFITIDGFGNKYEAGDDFCILMNDLDPAEGKGYFNAAGNCKSWFRITENGTSTWYPLGIMFDFNRDDIYEFNPVLMVCPVINYNVSQTAVTGVSTRKVSIEQLKNGIIIRNEETNDAYQLYNMSGQLISKGKILSDRQFVALPQKGIYLLRINNYSLKIIQK